MHGAAVIKKSFFPSALFKAFLVNNPDGTFTPRVFKSEKRSDFRVVCEIEQASWRMVVLHQRQDVEWNPSLVQTAIRFKKVLAEVAIHF